jgi:hypothetical protein
MTVRARRLLVCGLVAVTLAACTSSPVSPSGSVTVTTAGFAAPANGALIPNVSQPVTLTITDAVVTGAGAAVVYRFEVATDTLFTNKVVTKDIPQTAGQTSLTLAPLPPGQQYYWHVRTTGADTPGVFTAPLAFTIGAAVVLQAPTPRNPLTGATTIGWPVFTVNDVLRSGPAAALVYQFDISTSPTFSPILLSAIVLETPGQTSFAPVRSAPPPPRATLYWRATAMDNTNLISSPQSPVQVFTFVPVWAGTQPPGTNGHAVLGDNWDTQNVISFDGVKFTSPTLEELQMFDLLDRGFAPQAAIDWMNSHGYPTSAGYYPDVSVIGFPFEYMALVNGQWNLVIRVGG